MELSAGRFPVEQDLLEAARHRWLEGAEICIMFDNHEKLTRRNFPPLQSPKDGSFFFIPLQKLREFRKDGHVWSKKRDGKTIQESHVNLMVDGVAKLKCLYAYSKTDEKFQRRIYGLIEKKDVALFHYRKVKENNRKGKKVNHGAKEAIPTLVVASSQGFPSNVESTGWMETEDAEFYGTLCGTQELMESMEPYL